MYDGATMNLDWEDVRLFLAVARHGGFGAAARATGQQQSTLSRRVAGLERALGAVLFDRTKKGLELTSLGQRVAEAAKGAATSMHAITDAVVSESKSVSGQVRIALTETVASVFVLPRVLPRLLEQHPELTIDLVTSDDPADLAEREADLALRFFLPVRGDLVSKRVAKLETAPLAHRALARKLAGRSPAHWPWVAVHRPSGPSEEDQWASALAPRARLTTSSFHAQFEAVRAGVGVAVLPTVLRIADPALEVLPFDDVVPTPVIDLYLLTPKPLRRVPRVAAVFDALVAEFARATQQVTPRG